MAALPGVVEGRSVGISLRNAKTLQIRVLVEVIAAGDVAGDVRWGHIVGAGSRVLHLDVVCNGQEAIAADADSAGGGVGRLTLVDLSQPPKPTEAVAKLVASRRVATMTQRRGDTLVIFSPVRSLPFISWMGLDLFALI